MKIASSSKVTKVPVEMEGAKGAQIQWLIGKDGEAPNFAMRLFELQPGGHTPLHAHPHEHEVFILAGEGIVMDEGTERPIGPEDAILVSGGCKHNFQNTGDSVLRFLCLVPMSAC
jgi:quercetin dioxygenase-like cupin family protein